ncbi:MAG TPA: hypothetical protein PLU10_01035, partial [Chitinophagaceae bacterium]|nr:hypothetical protein [Chitinophagaceae bacterium]
MKKIIILFILAFTYSISWGQTGLYFPKQQLDNTNEASLREFILHYFHDFQQGDMDVVMQFQKQTERMKHFNFVVTMQGYEILHASIKLNINTQNQIVSVKYEGP